MSKKHYIQLAEMFRTELERLRTSRDNPEASSASKIQDEAARRAVERVAMRFANVAAGDNPRFNRARFFEACGIVG